ncbi:MAG TPA: serine/threonine-protein kinase, partial [Myxococcota bacterium]|nr:serine/threonine-protein kinase [Myxococcota bacterium]
MIAPGDVIADRYGVEELIGEGGLAQVWRVRHRDLGSVHALKLLLFRKPRLMERLILEGRIQAQLRHPNIVAVTDVVRHGGQVGLVMEYVDGVPLQSWLEVNQPLAVERALELFAPILAGVRAAHDAGVLHRDLKPANILLARVGRTVVPKVTDFGIAKVVEGSFEGLDTRSGAVMGTPGYLAPEQAVDASTVDRRADLFALGAILYEMLAGRRAFEGCDVSIPKDYELPELQSLRPEIPDVVARAVEKALAWDPADRYPEVGAFAAALLSGRPRLLEIVEGNTGSSEIGTNLGHFAPQDSLQPARDLIRETIEHVPMGANPTVIPSMSRAAETAGGETFGTRDEVSEPAERAAPADMPWARRPDDGAPAPWTSP